jgi:hypothetical protein
MLDLEEELQLSVRAREIARLPPDQLTAALIALLRQQRTAEIWIDALSSELRIIRHFAASRVTKNDRGKADTQLPGNPIGKRFNRWGGLGWLWRLGGHSGTW